MMNIWNALHLTIFVIWPSCAAEMTFNGCINYSDLPGTNYCYNISEIMDGISAWKHCTTFNYSNPIILEAIKKILRNPTSGKIQEVWIGYRETFRGSHEFIGHDKKTIATSSTLLGPDDLCLYLTNKTIDWQSCKMHLPIVCTHEKYRALAHDASRVCDYKGAIALSTFGTCFIPEGPCEEYGLEIQPEDPESDIGSIKGGKPINVKILDYLSPLTAGNESSKGNTTIYCHVPHSFSSPWMLLRRNKTAGGFLLRVHNDFMGNLPVCLGADVDTTRSYEDYFMHFIVRTHPTTDPYTKRRKYIWCFAQDIFTGRFYFSNKISLEDNVNCEHAIDHSKAPPLGTTVDSVASCLRCLKKIDISCEHDNCTTPCHEDGFCGPFKLTMTLMRLLNLSTDGRSGELGFKKCSENHQCASDLVRKLWDVTGDCNGDGLKNCDDIHDTLEFNCKDPRTLLETKKYLTCRAGNESDFVDVRDGNGTLRYYCQQFLNENLWSYPVYFPYLTSYVTSNISSSTISPEKEVGNFSESEDETVKTLRILKEIDSPLSKEQTENLVKKISNISQVQKEHLKKAQAKVNVSSMQQLIENAMLYVPDDTNISTSQVSLSKTSSLGVFASEQLTNETGRELEYGMKQYAVNTTQEIFRRDEQIEAGVVLTGFEMEPDVKFVVMIFAEDSDIFPEYSASDGDGDLGDDAVKGKINSPVVAATLTRNNTTVPLQDGAFVDVVIRAMRPAGIGQQKCCVYSDPKSGDASWRTEGCELLTSNVSSGLDVCRCNHLTHFAQLLTEAPVLTGDDAHHLRRFTVAACVISLLGQLGVLLTGVLYKRWRVKPENRVLLNMAAANTLFMALLLWQCFSPPLPVKRCSAQLLPAPSCWWTGVALHYIVLANFSWMLVCAVTHVLRIYKAPQGPKVVPHFLLVATTVGWSVPVLPVALVLAIDSAGYNFVPSVREFCYPSGRSFYLGVLAPISLIFSLNVVAYVLILKVIFPQCFAKAPPTQISLRQDCGGGNRNLRSIVIVLAFMFLFGLTWILGLTGYNLVSMYAQCLAVVLQGPTLFCIFVLGEKNLRAKIRKKFASKKRSEKKKMLQNSASSSSRGTSTSHSNDTANNSSTMGKRQRNNSYETRL